MNPKVNKNNMSGYILIITVFCLFLRGYALAVAQTDSAGKKPLDKEQNTGKPETVTLPNIEYKSDGLRDPFEGVFKTEPGLSQGVAEAAQAQPQIPPPPLTVQGIIWGSNIPQAIINDKVLKVGDTIAEAKITAISKDGVEVIFKNYTFKLTSPAAVQLQNLKPKPEGGQNEK